jgi:hypothetical protein
LDILYYNNTLIFTLPNAWIVVVRFVRAAVMLVDTLAFAAGFEEFVSDVRTALILRK